MQCRPRQLKQLMRRKALADCFYEAEEALLAKKALHSFKTLLAN